MFGRPKPQPRSTEPAAEPQTPDDSPATQALMAQVRAQLADKPLLGAQIAGKEILQHLLELSTNERGVQVEVLAVVLGACAGRASQFAALAGLKGDDPVLSALTIASVETKDGGTYYLGDAINYQLAEGQYSVWSLVAGYLQSAGEPIPDADEFFAHSAETLGGPDFGVPRFAEGTGTASTPLEYADALWPCFAESLRRYAPDPQLWPVAYGFALQEMLRMVHGNFDLGVLVRITMDSALAVAKVPV